MRLKGQGDVKIENYWRTTVSEPDGQESAPIPEKADVAIVGAGYTGLSAARILAKRGVKTAVLETEMAGWGASSRNGGMTLTGLKPSMQKVIAKYGRELSVELFRYSLESIDTVERVVQEENIRCAFRRTGHLVVANKARHFSAMTAQAELLRKEFHHDIHIVERADIQSEIGSGLYHGGLVDEASGGLNPAQFVSGLAIAAQKAGAWICTRARVERIRRTGAKFLIHTQRGSLNADSVLIATSGYTGKVTRNLQRRIIPIGSFIIATEKMSDDLARELSPRNRMIFDSRRFLNYFRVYENRLIFGGRAAFFPENENTILKSVHILRQDMLKVFPQLENVKVEYAWGGTLDFAFDMMPHAGQMDGLHYALGYAGHGVAMATHLGIKLAEAMLNDSVSNIPFSKYSFPHAPMYLYDGRPWFLPLAALWYRFLDFVD
jgi:glycine/D-amino acid oxidase-like deaminating enzyme